MKFLLPLLLLFGCTPAIAGPRILDADIVRGIRSVQNYVKNPEFETNIANVTDGGAGIITWSAVSPVDNTGSLVINSLLSGQVVKIQTKAQQKKLEGQGCIADFYYTGNASNYKAYVLNGITNVSGDFPLANAGAAANYQLIPFPCQAAGDTVDIAIESTAVTAGQIKLDSIFEGQNFYKNLPGFTLGSVLFSDGTSITEDNARLFWDTVNFRLGINTNVPSQALDVVGNAQASGSITASGVLKSLSSLVLEDPGAGTNTVTIQSGVPTASYVLTLPVDDGTANQVLTTDGSGILSWGNRVINTGDTMTGDLIMDNQKSVKFRELTVNGTDDITVKAPASLAAAYSLTLPVDDGTNGQVLTTDGTGILSWTTTGGGGKTFQLLARFDATTDPTLSGTWASQAGADPEVIVKACGGGGGGGGGTATNSGGGGAGARSHETHFTITPGNNYDFTLGAGGTEGVAGGDGGDGGDTLFDTTGTNIRVGVGARRGTGGNAGALAPGGMQGTNFDSIYMAFNYPGGRAGQNGVTAGMNGGNSFNFNGGDAQVGLQSGGGGGASDFAAGGDPGITGTGPAVDGTFCAGGGGGGLGTPADRSGGGGGDGVIEVWGWL